MTAAGKPSFGEKDLEKSVPASRLQVESRCCFRARGCRSAMGGEISNVKSHVREDQDLTTRKPLMTLGELGQGTEAPQLEEQLKEES